MEKILALGETEQNTLAFAFPNQSELIAFGCQSGQVSVWDIQENREIMLYVTHIDPCALSFSENSEVLSIVCYDGTCQLVSIATGKLQHEFISAGEKLSWGGYSSSRPLFLSVSERGVFSTIEATSFQTLSQDTLPLKDVFQGVASRGLPPTIWSSLYESPN
jgi:WD40 repeat protein